MIETGELAPDFTLTADDGETVRLSDYRGKKVILYFYPKDDTSGCTTQACGFRDRLDDLETRGAVVLGVSPDGIESHVKFKQKFDLNFTLLSDPDHTVAETYGVWGEKKMYGRAYEGILRTTFLIDEDGRVEEVYEKVKPKGHAEQILAALER